MAIGIHSVTSGIATERSLNDLDFVASRFEDIPDTLANGFLFRHVHPHERLGRLGRMTKQIVDADAELLDPAVLATALGDGLPECLAIYKDTREAGCDEPERRQNYANAGRDSRERSEAVYETLHMTNGKVPIGHPKPGTEQEAQRRKSADPGEWHWRVLDPDNAPKRGKAGPAGDKAETDGGYGSNPHD